MPTLYTPSMVTHDNFIEVIRWCVQVGDMHVFYFSPVWMELRSDVMEELKRECQRHKSRGLYKRATIVHHEKYIREFPELALSRYYVDNRGVEQRQLVPVCDACHREIHNGDRDFKPRFTVPERWD